MERREEIIEKSKETREVKRALAVKMSLKKIKHQEIGRILQVSKAFVSKWCLYYKEQGAKGLLLNYKGKKSYLKEEEKEEIITYLRNQEHSSVEKISTYIKEK